MAVNEDYTDKLILEDDKDYKEDLDIIERRILNFQQDISCDYNLASGEKINIIFLDIDGVVYPGRNEFIHSMRMGRENFRDFILEHTGCRIYFKKINKLPVLADISQELSKEIPPKLPLILKYNEDVYVVGYNKNKKIQMNKIYKDNPRYYLYSNLKCDEQMRTDCSVMSTQNIVSALESNKFHFPMDSLEHRSREKFGSSLYDISATLTFNRKSVKRLIDLCKIKKAYIVLSSSWRTNRNMQQIRNLFGLQNFGHLIIDKTVIGRNRSEEIMTWIKENSSIINSFVILDDYSDYFPEKFPNEFIKCSYNYGFTEELYEKALSILKNN